MTTWTAADNALLDQHRNDIAHRPVPPRPQDAPREPIAIVVTFATAA